MYTNNNGSVINQSEVSQAVGYSAENDESDARYTNLKNKLDSTNHMLNQLPVALLRLDINSTINSANEYFRSVFGEPISVCLGTCFTDYLTPQSYLVFIEEIKNCTKSCDSKELSIDIKCGSGKTKSVLAFMSSYNFGKDSQEVLLAIVDTSKQSNVETQLRKAKCYLERMANSDSLTGLANRMHFQESLRAGLLSARRNNSKVALLYFDIDGFKKVNDQYGHHEGDSLLCIISNRLRSRTRDVGKLARIGGDEFVMMIDYQGQPETVRTEAEKILTIVSEPVELHTATIQVTSSIGISVYPDNAKSPETLLQQADASMYESKKGGGNRVSFFTTELHAKITRRAELEKVLSEGVGKFQFRCMYQPIVRADDMEIHAYECLIRWNHPVLGNISPSEFIPLAERSGEIRNLGVLVLQNGCQLLKKLRGQSNRVKLAINLSPVQFSDEQLLEKVSETLSRYQIPAEDIEFEITENCFFQNRAKSREVAASLTALGCSLSIDDFGTGYSSFTRLIELPVSKLKIDRSIVQNICSSSNSIAIVKGITKIAHELGMTVVAEGVESSKQVEILQNLGCDYLQGFAVCPPVETSSKKIKQGFKFDKQKPQSEIYNQVVNA